MRNKPIFPVVILLILFIYPGCQSLKSIPDELYGTWTTEAHEYEGVFLELNQTTITFGKKDGSVDSFIVSKIKKQRMEGDWIKYVFFYRDQQLKKFELSLLYHPDNNGIIRFMNREQNAWVRGSS